MSVKAISCESETENKISNFLLLVLVILETKRVSLIIFLYLLIIKLNLLFFNYTKKFTKSYKNIHYENKLINFLI